MANEELRKKFAAKQPPNFRVEPAKGTHVKKVIISKITDGMPTYLKVQKVNQYMIHSYFSNHLF